ncbi:MAG: Gfo/Idh/MocA family oxidoreductase [Candidatus Omnitrophica bacterium]|nr:Gfo/Idh/MocA family oxidoreductase [Candidatus Omnitrophota bacterium]
MSLRPVEAVLLGAGSRGYSTFGGYAKAYPHNLKIIAVAEPDPARRERFAREHALPSAQVFTSWEELLDRPRLAEVLINATMDRVHYESTLRALDLGYHVLLEKPMATDPAACICLARKVEQTGLILQLCHSLRYNPFFIRLKELMDAPETGQVTSIIHNENVAFWHYAHSFVRGNWSNESRSAPGLLTKSCHDVDILYWLTGRVPEWVSSFGRLTHFRPDRAGAEIPARCTDGCPVEATCPYSAIRIYLGDHVDWPVNTIANDLSYEGRWQALREGPYGRCVFRCDNDVVDHQFTTFDYADGLIIGFHMHGHSHDNVRTLRVAKTGATIRGFLEKRELEVNHYLDGRQEIIHTGGPDDRHGGGDTLMLHEFIRLVRQGRPDEVNASARESCLSHLLVFAAEQARKENRIVHVPTFIHEIEQSVPADGIHE